VATTYTAVQPAKDNVRLQLSVDELGPDQQVFNVVRDGADHSAGSAEPFESVEIALRAGAWSNVAPKSNDAWALTTGISVRKGGFVFDFAGGSSFSTAEVEDVTMPERLNFALNLRYEKRF
jgi:hypothetical protein